jgi:hypothetical protein
MCGWQQGGIAPMDESIKGRRQSIQRSPGLAGEPSPCPHRFTQTFLDPA